MEQFEATRHERSGARKPAYTFTIVWQIQTLMIIFLV